MTTKAFVIALPWAKTSELSSNSRLHWRKKHRKVKAQKRVADALARERGWHKADPIPSDAELRVTIEYHPPMTVTRVDEDNVVTAQKGALDALAAVLRVDDSRFKLQAPVRGDRTLSGFVQIWIEVVT